jgi:hypothetical protein
MLAALAMAVRQIVFSARCSMNLQTPRKLLQVLYPASAAVGRPLRRRGRSQGV